MKIIINSLQIQLSNNINKSRNLSSQKPTRETMSLKQKEIKQKLDANVPLDEILTAYTSHKEKNKEDIDTYRRGWSNLKYEYTKKYDPLDKYHLNKNFDNEFNLHNDEGVAENLPYWDTKVNDSYYSLSKYERLKIFIKKMVSFYYDFYIFFGLNLIILIYFAKSKSKEIIF